MPPDILHYAAWTLIALAGASGARAWRIDRGLRALIPPSTEERWRQELIRDIYRFRPEFAAFEALDAAVIPIRWRRQYHGGRGAELVDRFCYTLAFAAGFLVAGVSLFRI